MCSNLQEINSITFGVLSSDEIKDMSVCHVNNTKKTGTGSLYDPRMGTTESGNNCVTCGEDASKCYGHFGHISLNTSILHPLYYKHIIHVLSCVCFKCFRCRLTKEHVTLQGLDKSKKYKKFLQILEKCKKTNVCSHSDCLSDQPRIRMCPTTNDILMSYDDKFEHKLELSVYQIEKIFKNVPDEDMVLMGFDPAINHIKNYIIRNLPVLPPMDRPFVRVGSNIWDDDITVQYMEIIKLNNALEELNKLPHENVIKIKKITNSIRFRIQTTFNNSQCKAKHTTNARPIKGIKERLTGKEGQIRNNMMGKRTNHSARTVIGPDPTLRSDEIIVPSKMASILTVPEMVTKYNIDRVQKLINNGLVKSLTKPNSTACINIKRYRLGTKLMTNDVIHRDGKQIIVSDPSSINIIKTDRVFRNGAYLEHIIESNRPYKVEIGMKVHRVLSDGDFVLLNRQPTLHRGSMIAMKVLIRDGKTIRMNLSICKSFNADFDGDEMNIHVPQTLETQAELKLLASAKQTIISQQSSKSNMAVVQDSLLGVYKMTSGIQKITKSCFFGIIYNTRVKKTIDVNQRIQQIRATLKNLGKKAQCFNGKGIISVFLPPTLNYQYRNNTNPLEPTVKIKNGVLYEGAFDKNIVGSSHVSLINIINKEYGADEALYFIDCIQFASNQWLLIHSFTVGFGDCLVTDNQKQLEIKQVIQKSFMECEGIKHTTNHPVVREIRINAALNKAKDVGLRIAKESLKDDNNFLSTVLSGSKGDFFNIAQITGLLGQQNLKGQRVGLQLNNDSRSLPHYNYGKLTPELEYESRGFISSSFIHGLNPKEFFFHAMSGREGICDTAMGTATSGYIQRKIVKLTEDITVKYDGTVRDATGKIYQNSYGYDGYDPLCTTKVNGVQDCCNVQRIVDKLM